MQQKQASRTAQYMALFRALESLAPEQQRLFTDPFASAFLSPSLRSVIVAAHVQPLRSLVSRVIDYRWPGARASGIARTRLIDDQVCQALQDGVEQVVILGAGFDSRPYRLASLKQIAIWEVDHPNTLQSKRQHLQKMLGSIPNHVHLVEIDFNRQTLNERLAVAGYNPALATFFIWEGVTNYLTEAAVDATLRFVSTVKTGSRILFTYIHRGVLEQPDQFANTQAVSHMLQRVGEKWTFGLDPTELPEYLNARGLQLIEDIGSLEYRARYMPAHGYHMHGYEFYRAALAQVMDRTV